MPNKETIEAIKARIAKCTPEDDKYYGYHTGYGFGYFGEWSLARCEYEPALNGKYSEMYVINDYPTYRGALGAAHRSIDEDIFVDIFENEIARDIFLLALKALMPEMTDKDKIEKINNYYFSETPEFIVLNYVDDFEYEDDSETT